LPRTYEISTLSFFSISNIEGHDIMARRVHKT
jgi:hypothetical protein